MKTICQLLCYTSVHLFSNSTSNSPSFSMYASQHNDLRKELIECALCLLFVQQKKKQNGNNSKKNQHRYMVEKSEMWQF